MSPLRLVLLLTLYSVTPLVAQFTFTGDGEPGITPKTWEDAGNWKTPGADPAPNFPDNGDNAEIGRANINVTTDIEVGTLAMDIGVSAEGTLLNLGANTFTINGASILTGNVKFLNGMLEAQGAVDLQGGLFLDGTDMTFSTMIVGSGSGTGLITLNNGGMATNTGSLTFPKDTQISGSVTNPGTLVNEGTWAKIGSTGQTGVSSLVSLADGSTLRVDAGSMLFQKGVAIGNATIDTQLSSGQVTFSGPVAITDRLTAVTGTNARINISGPNGTILDMTSGGKIASSGASEVIIGGSVIVKGGELIGSGSSPVVLSGSATVGQETASTNTGRFIWDTGTIKNLTNTAMGADLFTIENANLPGVSPLLIADGTLQNEGRIEHSISTVRLDEDGILNNALGGVYDFENGGSVFLESGSNGQFINGGILTKSGSGLSIINANLISSNRIEALNGQLRIANAASLTNVIRSDRGANVSTEIELGTSGTTNNYGDINFELDNNGVVQFVSGNHILGGTFTSSGDGQAESPSSFAIFQVPMNGSAAFDFISNAPFIAGTSTATPKFDLAGPLSNSGTLQCVKMLLIGSSAFKNSGDFTLLSPGLLEISEFGGASSGLFQNNGTFRITGSSSGVRVQENGLFLNNEAGGPDANPTGGTLLFDSVNSAFTTNDTSTATHLRNLSLIRNADGGNFINVNFDQPSTLAEVRVETDSLTLSKMVNISGGRLASHYTDIGTNPTPSRLNITGPSITGGVTVDLMNGGQVRYSGFGVDHQLTGGLFGQGSGECQLTSGFMRPMAGTINGGFNFTQNTLFRLHGGTMGSLDGALGNVGNFVVQSGLIQGSFNNGSSGVVTQIGGTVQGIYTNNGTYNWQGATIGGQFSNGTAVTGGGFLNLQGTAAKTLAMGATIDTWNEVNHFESGNLVMQQNSKITVREGSYIFHANGGINSNFTSGTVIRIDPDGELRKTGSAFGPNLTADTFSTEGTIVVDAGTLAISSDPILVNGGTAQVDTGTTLTLSREPEGTRFDTIIANGMFRVNSTGGGARADYAQSTGQVLSGNGTARLNLQQSGTVKPGNSPGTLTIDGDLVQSATAITEIEIGGMSAGQFDVIDVLDQATVAGTFDVSFINGFVPQVGDQFAVITSTSGVTLGSLTIQVANSPFIGEGFTASVVGNNLVLTWDKTGMDFDDWKTSKFTPAELLDDLISGPTADPDGDGIANFFEFIFGFEPKVGNGGHPIEFQLVDNGTGQQIPRFEIAVATNTSGYALKIELVDLTQSPPTVTSLVTTQDPTTPNGVIALVGSIPVAIREFYQVLAFSRSIP